MHMELRSRSRSKTPCIPEQTSLEEKDEVTQVTTRTRRSVRISASATSVKTKGSKKIFENVLKTSDYSSEEGDGGGGNFKRISLIRRMTENDKNQIIEDAKTAANGTNEVSALSLYRKAGCYFDKYPKTDWTYSPHSKDRVEIAPGVVAMPNMSRPTIHSAYLNNTTIDETDNMSFMEHNYATSLMTNQLKRRQLFKTANNDNNENYYHIVSESRRWKEKNWRQKVWVYFWSVLMVFTTIFWWIYRKQNNCLIWTAKKLHWLASSVMLLDTWLLRKNIKTNKTVKGVLLLCLVPLLLFGGWWLLSSLNSAIYGAWFNRTAQAPSVDQIVISPQIIDKTNFDKTNLNDNNRFDLDSDQLRVIASSMAANLNLDALMESAAKVSNLNVNDLKLEVSHLRAELDGIEANRKSELHKIISQCRLEQLRNTEKLRLELKRCCRYSLTNLEGYIRKLMSNLMSEQNERIRALFVANQELESQLNNLNQSVNLTLQTDEKRIVDEIPRKIALDPISDQRIREIVKSTLEIYDADKTGLVDYAMESMGGQIVTTRCTETYHSGTAVMSILGIPLWYPSNTPRTVITPGMHPGECWAFQNFPGFLVIKLSNRIRIDAFSMEHISRLLVPNGRVDSAPKQFEIYGLQVENDKNPVKLGAYSYDVNGEPLQFFAAFSNQLVFDMIELRIKSNHGNPNYTCLYRFRVHGHLA